MTIGECERCPRLLYGLHVRVVVDFMIEFLFS